MEYRVEHREQQGSAGSIYKGRVKQILPGMDAAFVNLGIDKPAFLHRDDMRQEALEHGEEIVVQITKESVQTKGAKLSTHIQLNGVYLVYLPFGQKVKLSRRIEQEGAIERLQDLGEKWSQGTEGLIFRTSSTNVSEAILRQELEQLRSEWQGMQEKSNKSPAPVQLNEHTGSVAQIVLQYMNADLEGCYVNDRTKHQMLQQMFSDSIWRSKILYAEQGDIITQTMRHDINKALHKKVWLPKGSYLLIEQLETLTMIDVNTGRFTGKDNMTQTAMQTNIRAIAEVARHIRLRDIGGIIILDFIDTGQEKERQELLQLLNDELERDPTETHVLGMTALGLVEMTRRKSRKSLQESVMTTCAQCAGTGRMVNNMMK